MSSQIDTNITREEKILQFIKKNRNCTKTDVINYMDKNGASPMTTHKIVKALIKEKKIISQMDKSNSQVHHLFINFKNKFNTIYDKLSEINACNDVLTEQREQIYKYHGLHKDGAHPFHTYHVYYEATYIESLYTMLQDLLIRIGKMIKSEVDSQILYSRTIILIQKVTVGFDVKKSHELLSGYLHNLDWEWCVHQYEQKLVFTKSELKASDVEALKNVIGFKALRNLRKVIKDYDARFLQLPSYLT